MSKDRFDLETDISHCRNILFDIETLYENVCDKFEMPPQVTDRIANTLLGIKELYEMRFDRLEDTFCQVFELNQYHDWEDDLYAAQDNETPTINITDFNDNITLSDYTMNSTITFNGGESMYITPGDSDVNLWNTHNTLVTGDYDKQLELKFK